MMIHPPMLYSGYTLFSVPFAFAVGALITRPVGLEWIRITRRFALGAWLCPRHRRRLAPAGLTPSWGGAATGRGTESRTRR